MTVFVLVHGGWHGGWCWQRVEPLLRAAGHEVQVPTLTGLGDRAHLGTPGTGLATHVEDVVARLEMDDLRNAVLVGHSSSGAVITGAAQRAAERLAGLVYLDAFVPQAGQSALELLPPARREHFLAQVDAHRIALDWDAALDGWAVRDEADRAWIRPRLRPHPLGGLTDPLPEGPVAELPRHYVQCTDKPGGDSFSGFAANARAHPGWQLHTLDTGHDAMVTAPQQLARVLLATTSVR